VCDVRSISPLKKGSDPFSLGSWHCLVRGVVRRGSDKRDMGWSRRVSDNRQDSNQLRLARAPRGGLRGPSPPVHPATTASRPVR
jgi:hypothetical protein